MMLNPGTPWLANLPKKLFVANAGYAVTVGYTAEDASERCTLELRPEKPVLGEVRITGEHLFRLMLEQRDGYLAVLDGPGPVEKIPVGAYSSGKTWLRRDEAEAFEAGDRKLVVSENTPASYVTGGPLTNTVRLHARGGQYLVMVRQIAGSDGKDYKFTRPDLAAPDWKAFREGKEVGSGKFKFG
jgi:hypothetical protein